MIESMKVILKLENFLIICIHIHPHVAHFLRIKSACMNNSLRNQNTLRMGILAIVR